MKGLAIEYVERVSELKRELTGMRSELDEISATFALRETKGKRLLRHVRENGGYLRPTGWRNGWTAWRRARAEWRQTGLDSAGCLSLEQRRLDIQERMGGMQAELQESAREVRARLGGLLLGLKANDADLRPHSVALSSDERIALRERRASFKELCTVICSRLHPTSAAERNEDTLRLSRNGTAMVIDRFADRHGRETGFATLQIVRPDGSRQPINVAEEARELIKLPYDVVVKVCQIFSEAPDEQGRLLRKLYFVRAAQGRQVRRIRT